MLSLGLALPFLLAGTLAPGGPASLAGPAVGFATAVALAGDELLVGRPNTSAVFPLPGSEKGGVVVFRRGADGRWAEAGSFSSSDAIIGDGFGSTIAVSGTVAVVSAPAAGAGRGAVYVFERGGSGWRQVARLAATGGAAGDRFGTALAIEGGLIVVGAPGADSARGAVYAYRGSGASWSGARVGGGAAAHDGFGSSVALVGGVLLVGAPGPSPLGGPFGGGQPPRQGAVTVFRSDAAGGWTAAGGLDAGADSVRTFGYALASAGGSAYVSAPLAGRGVGAVYEFRAEGGEWARVGQVAPPTGGGLFGAALAADGDNLLVGAPFAGNAKGEIYAFRRSAGAWQAPQKLTVDAVGMMIAFGAALAVRGDVAVVGGPGADFFEGVGYVFARGASGEWTARGTVVDRPSSLPAITGRERRCEGGDIEGYACSNVDVLSFVPTASLGAKRGIMLNDIWGWTHEASGREFALVGRMDGTSFVEVTDPVNPRYLGDLPLHEGATPAMWRDMKTYRDHAFIVSDGAGPHGMQVFDLTQLLDVANAPVTFRETAHYDKMASAHNIVINEQTGFAYTVGNSQGGETCGGALHMVDIRNPRQPTFAGCHADKSTGNARTGYTHDAQCVKYHGPDSRYAGKEICFNASETAVGIADVTDKASPKPISVAAYPNTAYAHQGWLSEDQRFFFLNDEGDEMTGKTPRTRTMVWDVADLEEPVLVKEFLGTTAATDHNMYVRGNYLFQSNYVSGLRVIDIADPKSPREVGFLDTMPFGENAPGFAGSWSNFPYFKSGTIVVTSMREGLFVVRHRPERPIP